MNQRKKDNIIFYGLIITFAISGLAASVIVTNMIFPGDAEATGCPTNFVVEHVDNALKAFEAGDAKEVKNQLDLAKEAVSQFSEEKE